MKWRDRLLHGDWSEKIAGPARYDTHDAEFYSHALDLALRIRRPFLLAFHAAVVALVMMALVIVFWIGWQVHTRVLPVTNVEHQVLTPIVERGKKVRVHFELDRLAACGVDISSTIIDSAGDFHALVSEHRDISGPFGHDHFNRTFDVPSDAAAGPARLRLGWSYVCPGNYSEVLSPLSLAFPDMPFEISNAP